MNTLEKINWLLTGLLIALALDSLLKRKETAFQEGRVIGIVETTIRQHQENTP